MKGSGLNVGQEVYVISTRQLPEKKNDPYLTRTYVIVVLFEGNKLLLPDSIYGDDSNGYRSYLVDPRNLEKVSETRKEELEEVIKKQYETLT